ncbi:MAG: hypothetical protein ABT940_03400 [Alphaproteobacteria bacterium]
MPSDQPNALRQEPGDEVTNMIRDGLKGVDDAKAARAADDANARQEEESTAGKEESEAEEEPASEPETQDVEHLREENARLKKRLGDQGNQVGTMRDQLAALGEILDQRMGTAGQPRHPADQVRARLAAKYGEEFTNDILGAVQAAQADVRSNILIQSMREEFPDFRDYEPTMAEMLQRDESLAEAVKSNPALLRTVYMAARGSRLDVVVKKAEGKGKALADQHRTEKERAFAETPAGVRGGKEPPPELSTKERGEVILRNILASRQDGRYSRE